MERDIIRPIPKDTQKDSQGVPWVEIFSPIELNHLHYEKWKIKKEIGKQQQEQGGE